MSAGNALFHSPVPGLFHRLGSLLPKHFLYPSPAGCRFEGMAAAHAFLSPPGQSTPTPLFFWHKKNGVIDSAWWMFKGVAVSALTPDGL
jgi:hypothetical protein